MICYVSPCVAPWIIWVLDLLLLLKSSPFVMEVYLSGQQIFSCMLASPIYLQVLFRNTILKLDRAFLFCPNSLTFHLIFWFWFRWAWVHQLCWLRSSTAMLPVNLLFLHVDCVILPWLLVRRCTEVLFPMQVESMNLCCWKQILTFHLQPQQKELEK